MLIDARVPVVFGELDAAMEDDAMLIEAETMPQGRVGISFQPGPGVLAAGCACCTPRGPLAQALGDMFMSRAKGSVPSFRRVIAIAATAEGRATMLAALTEDPVCAARFRVV
jgi:hypothetical protein